MEIYRAKRKYTTLMEIFGSLESINKGKGTEKSISTTITAKFNLILTLLMICKMDYKKYTIKMENWKILNILKMGKKMGKLNTIIRMAI